MKNKCSKFYKNLVNRLVQSTNIFLTNINSKKKEPNKQKGFNKFW